MRYMYEFFVKLTSLGFAGIILFTPINLKYKDKTLSVITTLENPVTEDIDKLIELGFVFKVDHYCSIIINDKKVHRTNIIKSIGKDSYDKDGFSKLDFNLENVDISDGDELMVFVKSKIVEDSLFKESTGLDTSILWKKLVPRQKTYFVYKQGLFIEKKNS